MGAEDILPKLGPPAPGVFMQGNLVFNAKQELIYRRDIERSVVETAVDFAAEHGEQMCSSLVIASAAGKAPSIHLDLATAEVFM